MAKGTLILWFIGTLTQVINLLQGIDINYGLVVRCWREKETHSCALMLKAVNIFKWVAILLKILKENFKQMNLSLAIQNFIGNLMLVDWIKAIKW